MTARRRAAVRALLVLVVGALILTLAPFDAAAIRLGPLSFAWWYALAAILLAASAAFAVLVTDRASAVENRR
jgi:hypothetical protein